MEMFAEMNRAETGVFMVTRDSGVGMILNGVGVFPVVLNLVYVARRARVCVRTFVRSIFRPFVPSFD